jgi:hypothetical protein
MLAQRLLILLIVTGWAESHVEAAVDPHASPVMYPAASAASFPDHGGDADDAARASMTSATARGSRPPTRAAPVQRDLDTVVDVPGAEVLGERLGPGDLAGVPGGDRRALAGQALGDRGADAARASRDEGDPADQLALGCEVELTDRGSNSCHACRWCSARSPAACSAGSPLTNWQSSPP